MVKMRIRTGELRSTREDGEDGLIFSWVTMLKSGHKSPHTIRTYSAGLDAYIRWHERQGLTAVEFTPGAVEKFMAELFAGGRRGGDGAVPAAGHPPVFRMAGRRAGQARPAGRDETAACSMRRSRRTSPRMPLAAPLATCKTRAFHDVRDRVIISLMAESMVRASELLDMKRDAVSVRNRTARVERGKGGKGRITAFSAETARDLDRHTGRTASHRLAGGPWPRSRSSAVTRTG